jgi:Tol biopolymer transport system component/DNA-binding winged helix-turn-helix (wHTH) protein
LKSLSFQFGPFRLDASDHLLLRDRTPLSLPPKAFDTLLYLVQNGGRLVTREELISAVWPNSFVEDGSLSVNISQVRRALGEMNDGEPYIETVPKKGYRFRSDVTLLEREARPHNGSLATHLPTSAVIQPAVTWPEIANGASDSRKRPHTKSWSMLATLLTALVFGSVVYTVAKRSNAPAPFTSMKIGRLTSLGEIAGAAISPDAKYVAYALNEAKGQSVWIRRIAMPSGTRVLAPEPGDLSNLTFSPDGDYLYYVRASQDGMRTLYRMPFVGGDSTRVLPGVIGPIGFSPDGERFAFIRVDPAAWETALMVANTDGTGARRIAVRKRPQYFSPYGLVWSSDGLSVSCFAGNAADYFGPAFHVVQLRLSDGAETAITAKAWAWAGAIVSSRAGKALLVAASEQAAEALQIWRVSLPGGQVSPVTNDLSNYTALSLASDGKTLAAVKTDNSAGLWVAPAKDLNRVTPISSGNLQSLGNISWTRAGRIAYSARAGGYLSIFLTAGGGRTKQLTLDRGNRLEAAITPDGQFLLFQLGGKIWRMDLDGSNQRQLTYGAHDVHPSPSADSRSVIYASFANWSPAIGGKPTLWSVSIEGGKPRQLTGLATSLPQVSPDGKLIACAYFPGEDPRFSQNGMAVFPFTGGQPLRVFKRLSFASDPVDWAPDGRGLDYVVTEQGIGNIWRQPLSGGAPIQLTHFNAENLFDFAWSLDGRQLATARGKSISDVVLIKGSN